MTARIPLCLSFLLLHAMMVQAQLDSVPRWSLALSPQVGFVIAHHESIQHLIQGHSAGGHVYAKRQVDGSKYWHQAYNVPEHGVDFTFISTGNPTQLGRQISSSYMLNLPLLRKQIVGDNIQIPSTGFAHWLGLGLGMGYATKRWDLETNHQAAVLGSKLNVAISIQYSTRLWAFHSADLRAGLRISHFSNGAFQLPNLGTNNAGVFLSYASRSKSPTTIHVLAAPAHERYLFSVGLVGGLKEIPPPTGRKYAALVLSTLAERRVSYKSAFGLGLDLLYDSSIRPQVQPRTDVVVTPMQVMQLGAVFSYSLFFDRFALKIQQGYYLADAWRLSGSLYHRVGLRYTIGEHMYAQLTLKTHFAKADYGEVGIGYCFRK